EFVAIDSAGLLDRPPRVSHSIARTSSYAAPDPAWRGELSRAMGTPHPLHRGTEVDRTEASVPTARLLPFSAPGGKHRQLLAELPQPAGGFGVTGRRRWLRGPLLHKVPSRRGFHLGGRREIDQRLGPFLGADRPEADPSPHEPAVDAVAGRESCRDEPGVQRIDRDGGPVEAPRELVREEQVRELRLRVLQ